MWLSLSYCLGHCFPQEGALGSASGGAFGLAGLGFLSLPAGGEQAQLVSWPFPALPRSLPPTQETRHHPGTWMQPRLCHFLSLFALGLVCQPPTSFLGRLFDRPTTA